MELSCFYQTEISPKEIFNLMQNNIFDFSQNIITKNHKYLILRSKLLNLLRQISAKMFFKSQTYFLSIYYLDILFTNNKNKEIDLNYYKMALACLLLSAKYCENDPLVPALKYFIKIYNKKIGNKSAISVSDLFYSEVMAIKLLNHKLNYYTIYDFNSFFFNHNILTEEQIKSIDPDFDIKNTKNIFNKHNNNSSKMQKIYQKIYRLSRYYLDIILGKKVCVKYSSLLISVYILKKSIESILLQEIYYNDDNDEISKEKFLIKIDNDFDEVIKGYYGLDYENIPEYQQLINEFDIKQLIRQNDFKGLHQRRYNIRQNKTLSSFNKKENGQIIKKLKDKDKDNANGRTKDNDNFTLQKLNFQKLKSTNNLKEKLKKFQTLNDFSEKTIPALNNKTIEIDDNRGLEKKYMNRNFLMNKSINEKYSSKEKKTINIDIKNYFSEKLNNIKNTDTNFFSPNNISANKNMNIIIKRTKSKDNKKEIYENLNINDLDYNDEINYASYLGRLTLNTNNLTNNNKNKPFKMNQPYYKKVIQNYGSKLNNRNIKNNNKKSHKYNFAFINTNPELKNINTIQKTFNEFNTETKIKNNINNKLNNKIFETLNLNRDLKKKASFSNNKGKICKLLHINLNQKFSEVNSPSNNLYINKKINDEILSSASYINRMNSIMKKIERKSSNSFKKFENLNNKRKNERYKDIQLNSNFNEQQNNNKLNNYRIDSDENENNSSSNKLSNSLKLLGFKLMMKSQKEKTKEKNYKNKNKIYFTDNNKTLSIDENPNQLNKEQNLNGYLMAKKIEVTKSKFDNEIKHKLNKNKNNNLLNYNRYIIKNSEENINKKNTSTIVINNNININFGNKSINGYKETKKYGQNSISSLLYKIPISYKNTENY